MARSCPWDFFTFCNFLKKYLFIGFRISILTPTLKQIVRECIILHDK